MFITAWHEDVGRLEVTVKHTARVRVLHGVRRTREEVDSIAKVESAAVAVLRQWQAAHDQLHRVIRLTRVRAIGDDAGVVHLRDPLVPQPSQRLLLRPEACQGLVRGPGAGGEPDPVTPQQLERDPAPDRLDLLRLPNDAEAALAELAAQAVRPDRPAAHRPA